MQIVLPIRALSVNQTWRGRRFKTDLYQQYERDCFKLIRGTPVKGEVEIHFQFHYKKHPYDLDNGIKPILDILVKTGMIDDDRYLMKLIAEKFVGVEDKIVIDILPFGNV